MEHELIAQIAAHNRKLSALRFELTQLKAGYKDTTTEQQELANLLAEIESYTADMIAFNGQLERILSTNVWGCGLPLPLRSPQLILRGSNKKRPTKNG
ncbi:hypothetical protein [Burkholderia sp. S171]|uniref:hypothetical protein n=1 Tax=Burkholderia sp. S171 TaxID=1641860 RepID=UPI00131C5FA0|nr:hypothetical protein [Burkholderia sp. S171]